MITVKCFSTVDPSYIESTENESNYGTHFNCLTSYLCGECLSNHSVPIGSIEVKGVALLH